MIKVFIFIGLGFLSCSVQAKTLFYLTGKLNVNSATHAELMQLPFIGEKKASNIIQQRAQANFTGLQDLLRVEGIGGDLLQAISQYVIFSQKSTLQYNELNQPPLVDISSFSGNIQALDNKKYYSTLTTLITQAKQQIDLCFYIFKTSESPHNLANKLLKDLIKKQQQGIRVSVTLEKSDKPKDLINQWNQATAKKLNKAGIKVYFDHINQVTHSKLAIIDLEYVVIGSHNLTHTALIDNNEVSVLLKDKALARYFYRYIEALRE